MPRRVSLPGANELFRPTVGSHEPQSVEVPQQSKAHRARKTSQDATSRGKHAGSGRVRHDEKITVYVSTEELLALENARLQLRAQGVAADRGRIVREAIAIALADLDLRGTESALVTRLDQ